MKYESVVFQECIPAPRKINVQDDQTLAIFNWIEQLFRCNIVYSVGCNFALLNHLKHKSTTSTAHFKTWSDNKRI